MGKVSCNRSALLRKHPSAAPGAGALEGLPSVTGKASGARWVSSSALVNTHVGTFVTMTGYGQAGESLIAPGARTAAQTRSASVPRVGKHPCANSAGGSPGDWEGGTCPQSYWSCRISTGRPLTTCSFNSVASEWANIVIKHFIVYSKRLGCEHNGRSCFPLLTVTALSDLALGSISPHTIPLCSPRSQLHAGVTSCEQRGDSSTAQMLAPCSTTPLQTLPLNIQNLSEDRQQGADIRAGGCWMLPPTISSWAQMMEHCWDLGTVPAPQLPAQGNRAIPGKTTDSKISAPADRGATRRLQRPSTGSPLPAWAGAEASHWHAMHEAASDGRHCNIPELSARAAECRCEDGRLFPTIYVIPQKMVPCRTASRASGRRTAQ